MTHTITNERDLVSASDYVRLKTDPTLLICSKSGDLYRRADGDRWEWPGYRVQRGQAEPAFGFEDSVHMPPRDGQATTAPKKRAAA